MSDDAVVDLIFAPGFSTAAAVTDLSGRGVGMDAVRDRGRAPGRPGERREPPRRGTTVRFVLPFTVMMTPGDDGRGGRPGLRRAARVGRRDGAGGRVTASRPIGAARAFVLRDRTIPLIDLARALGRGVGRDRRRCHRGDRRRRRPMGRPGGRPAGRALDVMLKPPEGLLAGVPGIAGTTLLGRRPRADRSRLAAASR